MGRKRKVSGLVNRNGVWHIDKVIYGKRVCQSTKEKNLKRAEDFLNYLIEEKRNLKLFGIRPARKFKEAAIKYIKENEKSSIKNDIIHINHLLPFIGEVDIKNIHMGVLQDFILKRQKDKVKNSTINHSLQVLKHILNLASSDWIDENGLTWLENSPRIKYLKELEKRKPYPLSWEEQKTLFSLLPEHLYKMALFKVNTGTREQEVCNLKWEWEVYLKEIDSSVFIIPNEFVKNREDRVIVLNKIAKEVIDSCRNNGSDYVFTYAGKKVSKMNNTAWKNARIKAGFEFLRIHDLKHTFGRRLRSAGVSFEDRQDLLGHKNGKITTHYSSAEIENLINASNKIIFNNSRKKPTLLKVKA